MFPIASRLPRPLAALLLSLAAAAQAEPPRLALETAGGDAWAFRQQVGGRVDGGCEQVMLRSPAGVVPAWQAQGRFAAEVPLGAGRNEVRAECWVDGAIAAESAPQQWRQRLEAAPKAWIRTRVADGSIILDAGRSERAQAQPAPIVRYRWRARAGNPAPLVQIPASELQGEQIELRAPSVNGEYYVSLEVEDALGRVDESTAVFRVEQGRPIEVDLAREHPAWVDEAVVYGVVPFFFGDGGYKDVSERLDEIAATGATAIWLSPINATPDDDFGYAVTDHFRLRDTFGSEAEFRALVRSAHARGLRVIMDFVPNHFSDRHPYFVDAERRGEASPYHDWFERDAQGEPTGYFDWDNLKNLNFDNPEVQNYMIAAAAHWVERYGIDGFRVDASWGVRERAPEFWTRWRQELKRIDPDLFLLAEASARDPYYVTRGFDAAYDWSGKLGEWAWEDVFGEIGERVDLERLRSALTNAGAGYPDDTLTLRFLNTNDSGERFISRYGAGLTRVAAALTFTLPGVPLIYTGDEVGAEFEPYDEGPALHWRDTEGLAAHYAALAKLRRQTPALRSRELRLIGNDQETRVLSFVRPGPTPGENVLVALNFGETPVEVTLAPAAAPFGQEGQAPTLRLPPYGIALLSAAGREK